MVWTPCSFGLGRVSRLGALGRRQLVRGAARRGDIGPRSKPAGIPDCETCGANHHDHAEQTSQSRREAVNGNADRGAEVDVLELTVVSHTQTLRGHTRTRSAQLSSFRGSTSSPPTGSATRRCLRHTRVISALLSPAGCLSTPAAGLPVRRLSQPHERTSGGNVVLLTVATRTSYSGGWPGGFAHQQ